MRGLQLWKLSQVLSLPPERSQDTSHTKEVDQPGSFYWIMGELVH